MEEMERDFVTFTDDDGNDFELDVIDYFEYEGQEYAVLMDLSEECEHDEDEECDCGHDVYIMKIVVNGDMEEFLPADEDKFDVLTAIVEERLAGDCCDDDCCCDEDGVLACELERLNLGFRECLRAKAHIYNVCSVLNGVVYAFYNVGDIH